MNFQYRVSVMNENTLEEAWHVRLSRLKVFTFASLLVIITFVLLTFLIIWTPIRYYLPGFSGSDNRVEIINKAMKVDSLLLQMDMHSTYLTVLKSLISGEIIDEDFPLIDSVSLQERAEVLLEKSKAEREFVERYEREEKYNLASLSFKEIENISVFFKPVNGVISSSFSMEDLQYGISILTAPNTSVVSVTAGFVVHTAFTFDYGWVIQVQHDDNYLSIYKHNNALLKKPGDNVKAGEVIAFTGEEPGKKIGNHFYFELWRQGRPVNPEEIIIF